MYISICISAFISVFTILHLSISISILYLYPGYFIGLFVVKQMLQKNKIWLNMNYCHSLSLSLSIEYSSLNETNTCSIRIFIHFIIPQFIHFKNYYEEN